LSFYIFAHGMSYFARFKAFLLLGITAIMVVHSSVPHDFHVHQLSEQETHSHSLVDHHHHHHDHSTENLSNTAHGHPAQQSYHSHSDHSHEYVLTAKTQLKKLKLTQLYIHRPDAVSTIQYFKTRKGSFTFWNLPKPDEPDRNSGAPRAPPALG